MAVWSTVKLSQLEGQRRIDAEYYQPKYSATLEALHALNAVPLEKVAKPVKRKFEPKAGQSFSYIEISGVDTGTGVINALSLPGDDIPARAQWVVQKGDVIISTVRPVRNAIALITAEEDGFVCSSGFAVLKAEKVAPEFLFTFLKAKPIVELLDRKTTVTVYPAVSWQDILTIPIFIPDKELEQFVRERVAEAQSELKRSKSLYLQAERMVLKELGWDELDLSQPKCWTVYLSRAREVHRIDAEHFQPKYDKLIAHLKKTGKGRPIRDILSEPIQKGVTPEYDPDGPIVVINSQHLGQYCLNFEATDRTTEAFWKANRQAQIRQNDVMIYATGAYIGRTNTYLETDRALAGVDILLVRPTDECNPLYLAVFLNAPPGLMQSKKFASGSGQAHIYPEDVSCYWVYLPSWDFQQRVAELVRQSYQARQKAKALLEKAKKEVEELIKGGIKARHDTEA